MAQIPEYDEENLEDMDDIIRSDWDY